MGGVSGNAGASPPNYSSKKFSLYVQVALDEAPLQG